MDAEELFSCSFGRPACLSYSDKVVDGNAVCFDSWTCSYEGYVCKSDYDRAVDQFNELVRDYNQLLSYAQALEDCVASGRTVDEIRRCVN